MPGGEGSSEEFVEDDSGGEEEEEKEDEGDSSASYDSGEESEDDDDDGATGDDSDVFETPIKARKRSRTPTQPAASAPASAAGKNKRKPPADAAASSSTSSKKKGPARAEPAASTKTITAGGGTAAAAGAKGKGKGKGAAAAAAAGDSTTPPQARSAASSSPPEDGSPSAPGGAGGAGGRSGGKGSPAAASAPHPAKPASGGVVRAAGGGRAAKPMPAKTPKAAVSDYMQQSNRPYSYINVFDNLRKKIPKAMVQKLLDELVRDGTLNVQEYGKAKIYYANQDALPNGAGDASADKMRRLDQEAKSLTSQLDIASKQEQESRSRVSLLSSQPTDAALAEKLDKSTQELEQAEERNAAAKGEGRSVVAGGMKAAKSDFNKFRALWVNRKRNAMDMVDMIADGMEKKPKAVMDQLGVELDEEPIPAKL